MEKKGLALETKDTIHTRRN